MRAFLPKAHALALEPAVLRIYPAGMGAAMLVVVQVAGMLTVWMRFGR